jgi:hypothetical protein
MDAWIQVLTYSQPPCASVYACMHASLLNIYTHTHIHIHTPYRIGFFEPDHVDDDKCVTVMDVHTRYVCMYMYVCIYLYINKDCCGRTHEVCMHTCIYVCGWWQVCYCHGRTHNVCMYVYVCRYLFVTVVDVHTSYVCICMYVFVHFNTDCHGRTHKICLHVCMYACMHVCIYVCMYVWMGVCMYS